MADVVGGGKERRIVVAVDEGEESMYALTWAINNIVSQNSNDTLVLLYAKPPRMLYSAIDGTDVIMSMEKYSKGVADSVIEKSKKICNHLQNVKVEARVENGDPRDVICEMVEKLGADVLIVGTHGYGMIKRAFLGSVSTHCVQNVKCPVLIVKRPKSTAQSKRSE